MLSPFELNTRLGETDCPAEKLEFSVVVTVPSCDLNLKFIFLRHVVAEPGELVTFSRDEEVVDVDDDPQVTLGVSEDTVGDLALRDPISFISLLTTVSHASGASRVPYSARTWFPTYFPPSDPAPGSSM